MASYQSWFDQFTPLAKPIKAVLSDDRAIAATVIGCINVTIRMHNVCGTDVFAGENAPIYGKFIWGTVAMARIGR